MNINIRLQMDDTALAPFRHAWKHASSNHRDVALAPLTAAALHHHAALPEHSLPDDLRVRINLVPQIAEMLNDADWQIDDEARTGLAGALAYFNDPSDLIPDDHPRFGLLDDAIVIELALAESGREWLAWQEFSALRTQLSGIGPMNRNDWEHLRHDLPRLLAAQRQGSYVDSRFAPRDPRSRFRVLGDLPRFDMN